MLWACELKSRSWWTENLNLVRICVEMLQTLSVWLTDTRCPHYFVSNCNLLDNSFNVGSVASKLMSVYEEYLSTWFVNNYLGQCAQLCPNYMSKLFSNASTSVKLQNAVSEIVQWRLNTSVDDLLYAITNIVETAIPTGVTQPLTARACFCWTNELTKIDTHFCVYFSAVALLHVALRITRNGISDELVEILSTLLRGPNFIQCRSVLSLHGTELNTSELVELLQKFAVEHMTIYRQLRARDFGSVVT